MPIPIKPVHQLDEHNELFGNKTDMGDLQGSLSQMQSMFLGSETRTAAVKYDEETMKMLAAIDESDYRMADDEGREVVSLSSTRDGETQKLVPKTISDNHMLRLKTQELIAGSGRLVALTQKGRIALRDNWLREANSYKSNRVEEKFNINEVRRAQKENNENKREATQHKFKRVNG